MPKTIHDCQQDALRMRAHQMAVSADSLAWKYDLSHTPVNQAPRCHRPGRRIHFVAITVVAPPFRELIVNSSINLLVPGRPIPKPPPVEYPSCMASSTLGIPGP